MIIFLLLFGQLIYLVFGISIIEAMFAQRLFFMSSLLDIYYFDFFEGKPLYWSSSFLKPFLTYPYDIPPAFLIGKEYFGNAEIQANNGIISDGYTNFGMLGVLFNILVTVIIIRIIDAQKISHRFFGVFFIMFTTFQSSALSTLLLTHGIVILLLVSILVLRKTSAWMSMQFHVKL
jgi:hypothetical protein